jgi:beta-galactosidase
MKPPSIDGGSFFLRVGRRRGLVQAIHAMDDKKAFLHDPYLVKPEVRSETGDETNKTYRLRWAVDGDSDKFIDGTVALCFDDCGAVRLSYDLAPSEKCFRDVRFAEFGLSLFADGNRVDWLGDGPLTSVPGKSKMNVFGKWAMHKDDYRFAGNRSKVKWAAVSSNGSAAQPLVIESETGNVSFENIGGRICLTENLAVAGYGGKASNPGSLKSPADINLKGSFTIYAGELDAPPSDVVPDLTFTQHYGY